MLKNDISLDQVIEKLKASNPGSTPGNVASININRDNEWLFCEALDFLDREIANHLPISSAIKSIQLILNNELRLFCGYNYLQFDDNTHFDALFETDFRSEFPWRTSQRYMRMIETLHSNCSEAERNDVIALGRKILFQRDRIVRRAGSWENTDFITFLCTQN